MFALLPKQARQHRSNLFSEDDRGDSQRFQFFPGPIRFIARFEGADLHARFRMRWNPVLCQPGLKLFGIIDIGEYAQLHFESLRL